MKCLLLIWGRRWCVAADVIGLWIFRCFVGGQSEGRKWQQPIREADAPIFSYCNIYIDYLKIIIFYNWKLVKLMKSKILIILVIIFHFIQVIKEKIKMIIRITIIFKFKIFYIFIIIHINLNLNFSSISHSHFIKLILNNKSLNINELFNKYEIFMKNI